MIFRTELEQIRSLGYSFEHPWQVVDQFEQKIADFFGAPYAVATDSCTHALELSFLITACRNQTVEVPVHTYMSIPMMLTKIGQPWKFVEKFWNDSYRFDPVDIVDAAFSWQPQSYKAGSLTCISFQQKKHLPIGRGGIILTDNKTHYDRLQRLCRDGRDRKLLQTEDNIQEVGYHYYMTPEDAARGILLFDQYSQQPPVIKSWQNYRVLTEYDVYADHVVS